MLRALFVDRRIFPKNMRVVDPWGKLCNNHVEKRLVREKGRSGALCSFLLFLLGVSGCFAVFPKETLNERTVDVSLRELRLHPERYKGGKVLLGGMILKTRHLQGETVIEVLQKPLDWRNAPKDVDKSEGRFLVVSDGFLDEAIYRRGRMITVVGEVLGVRSQVLGEINYGYTLISIDKLVLWDKAGTGPIIRIGIGVTGTM
jgi:outer membrane lipoprotein